MLGNNGRTFWESFLIRKINSSKSVVAWIPGFLLKSETAEVLHVVFYYEIQVFMVLFVDRRKGAA